ncbi:hypothetical protein [Capillimicrobium parvum]|uniref:Uncharacterized protein n=1 Tax=Capillimicrobium parvum TaxID=2884022 RepID=A0A9E6XVK8_9ACTN|nr:hypothetical protein [Capillimicrobium parvum]UGS35259.1 hypothetical protein DSM104329_01646 [Capillimicrobium parvum]
MVRKLLSRPVALVLILLMAAGSVAMWVVVPVLWLWLGSKLQEGSSPSLGPYLLVIVGIPVTMVIIGKVLSRLDRLYAAVLRAPRRQRVQASWQKSMRGERGSTRQRTILDSVMVVSVSVALLAFGVWFFGFAGSSLPS